MGLEQHVYTATHEHGHILDLVITHQSDYLISRTPFGDEFISDHASLLTYIQVIRSTPLVKNVTKRKLKSVNVVDFQRDILDSGIDLDSDMSLDGFVSLQNSTCMIVWRNMPLLLPGLSVLKERARKQKGNGE